MNPEIDFINKLTQFQLGSESNDDNHYFMKVSVGLFNYLNNYENIKQIDENILKYKTVYGNAYFYK